LLLITTAHYAWLTTQVRDDLGSLPDDPAFYRQMTQLHFFSGWKTRLRAVSDPVPTTILWGAQDRLIPASYAGSIGGTVKLLADRRHWLLLEQPGRVTDEVRALAQ